MLTREMITAAAEAATERGGARRVTKRSELRECVVVDSCGGLLTPEGEYVYAAPCWGVDAEYRGRREFWRLDGRTVISLPVADL